MMEPTHHLCRNRACTKQAPNPTRGVKTGHLVFWVNWQWISSLRLTGLIVTLFGTIRARNAGRVMSSAYVATVLGLLLWSGRGK